MKEIRKLKLEELGRIDVPTFKEIGKVPIVLVLDNIRSGLNVGSLFRTSDAFLLEKMMLCGITARPPHKEILKTAIGANNAVDWLYYENVTDALKELREGGFEIIGIEQTTQSVLIDKFDVDPNKKYAIVLGNEVNGISESSLPEIDTFLEIPQFGTKHSLNVSVCGGIVIHKFAKEYLKSIPITS